MIQSEINNTCRVSNQSNCILQTWWIHDQEVVTSDGNDIMTVNTLAIHTFSAGISNHVTVKRLSVFHLDGRVLWGEAKLQGVFRLGISVVTHMQWLLCTCIFWKFEQQQPLRSSASHPWTYLDPWYYLANSIDTVIKSPDLQLLCHMIFPYQNKS